MDNIKNIMIDYMVNYYNVKNKIECPHCNSRIQTNDLKNIPFCGTNQGLVKQENYVPPYYCKKCGGRIEKIVC